MPYHALLEKWLAFGPDEDLAALEFIRRFFSHRGIDAWAPDALLPPFALMAEGEPFTLLAGALNGADGPLAARTRSMALLMTLERRLRRGERELGVLIVPAPAALPALAPLLPPLRRLLLGFAGPALPATRLLRLADEPAAADPLSALALAADALL